MPVTEPSRKQPPRTGLEGKTAAVTATRGPLAAACAAVLAERGARTSVLGDADALPPDLDVLVAIFDGAGLPLPAGPDAADGEWEDAVGRAGQRLYRVARQATAAMHERGRGAIVVVAPLAGIVGIRGASIVAAAAGALFASARTLAIEYAPTVRINLIAYGCVEGDPFSDWLRTTDPNRTQELDETLTLLERLAHPNEVATAAAFLGSDRASFVVAHQLIVDGGYLVR